MRFASELTRAADQKTNFCDPTWNSKVPDDEKRKTSRCFETSVCGYLLELLGHGCCYITL
jgi:hypothetical protein